VAGASKLNGWAPALLVAGFALQIAVWVMVIPAFEDYDEFDHIYRASGVTHGQVVAPAVPRPGDPPSTVIADRRLVEAGYEECLSLPYTSPERCGVVRDAGRGLVVVISWAAFYNPAYYAVVGWAERVGSGLSAAVATRAFSVLISVAVLAWAAWLTRSWPKARSGIRGLLLSASPILLFSLAIVAPNGLEMVSGVLWWVGLITLAQARPLPRGLWPALATAGCLLVTLRFLGPVWLVLATAVALLWRPREIISALRRHARQALAAAVAVSIAGAAALAWLVTQRSHVIVSPPLQPGMGLAGGVRHSTADLPSMIVQLVSAIPGRNIAPPSLLVVAWLLPFVLLLLNVEWRRDPGARRALICLIATVVIFPVAFQGAMFERLAHFWQGRYILPLAVGIPLLAAASGAASPTRLRVNDAVTVIGVTLAQMIALVAALRWYARHSPLTREGTFPLLPGWVLIALMALGCALLACALLARRRQPEQPASTGGPAGPGLLAVR
jgi:Predicted membrane protein (DUF2142)